MDQVPHFCGNRHVREAAKEDLFTVGHRDDLFALQREQAQGDHFTPGLAGIFLP